MIAILGSIYSNELHIHEQSGNDLGLDLLTILHQSRVSYPISNGLVGKADNHLRVM